VKAILFVVAMNSYDMRLYEDENVNRMHEAIQLFDEICNSKWFRSTALVLFLNKSDLFKEKIEKVDLKVCFADYAGGCNYTNGSNYMQVWKPKRNILVGLMFFSFGRPSSSR